MSEHDDVLAGAVVTSPCCHHTAPIGVFMDREPRGCPNCGADLEAIREASSEVLES